MTRRGLIRLVAWVAAAGVLAFAAFRASGAGAPYPLYPLLAYTPHAVLAGVLAVAVAVAARERWAACAALAGTLVLAALVAPRIFAGAGEAPEPPSDPLRVMTMNLAVGKANTDEVAELALAEDVDVLALQELTPDAADALTDALGDAFPHAVLDSREGSFGSGIVSREPMRAIPRPPVIPGTRIAAGRVGVDDAPGGEVELWSVHPLPPTSGPNVRDLRAYLDSIPGPDPAGPPRILAGDFNSTLDHPELRGLLDRGYRDAADALGDGLAATWPSGSVLPGVTIDHVLGDERAAFSGLSVHGIEGSDHKALVVSVSFPAP